MVQWLRLCASTAGGTGLVSDQGAKILHATRHSQKINDNNKRLKERKLSSPLLPKEPHDQSCPDSQTKSGH